MSTEKNQHKGFHKGPENHYVKARVMFLELLPERASHGSTSQKGILVANEGLVRNSPAKNSGEDDLSWFDWLYWFVSLLRYDVFSLM